MLALEPAEILRLHANAAAKRRAMLLAALRAMAIQRRRQRPGDLELDAAAQAAAVDGGHGGFLGCSRRHLCRRLLPFCRTHSKLSAKSRTFTRRLNPLFLPTRPTPRHPAFALVATADKAPVLFRRLDALLWLSLSISSTGLKNAPV